MKKIILTVTILLLLCDGVYAQHAPLPKNNNQTVPTILYSGNTVIVGFNMYDNKGLAAQLISEENNAITIIFPDDNVTCKIDNKGNVLEGESYISQKGLGKPIAFIQIYETKKKIVNPELDINKTLSNFTLIETTSGNVVFGISDYNKTERSFIVYTKPSSNKIKFTLEKSIWKVAYSKDARINSNSNIAALYLYISNTRRFFTK